MYISYEPSKKLDASDAVNVARLTENDNPFISQHVLQVEIATHLKQKKPRDAWLF
jgi:spore coat polysaccharide biosynthesis protein SpsF (cytidylyltransferase family)